MADGGGKPDEGMCAEMAALIAERKASEPQSPRMPNFIDADMERLDAEMQGLAEPRVMAEVFGEDPKVDRRKFLQWVGGLAAAYGVSLVPRDAFADDTTTMVDMGTGGPKFDPKKVCIITISATGGMEILGSAGGYIGNTDNQLGPLKSPPNSMSPGAFNFPVTMGSNQTKHFLQMYGGNMIHINTHGNTVSHQEGERLNAAGTRTDIRMPDHNAIVALQDLPASSLNYLNDGDPTVFTAGALSGTSLNNLGSFLAMANPNELSPNQPKVDSRVLSDASLKALYDARTAELAKIRDNERFLPGLRARAKERQISQGIHGDVKKILQGLAAAQQKYKGNQMLVEVATGISTFKAGLTRAIKIGKGGYDTHGKMPIATIMLNKELYGNIHLMFQEAIAQGTTVCVIVEADFGRQDNGPGDGLSGHFDNGHVEIYHPFINGSFLLGPMAANKQLLGSPDTHINAYDAQQYIREFTGCDNMKVPNRNINIIGLSAAHKVRDQLKKTA